MEASFSAETAMAYFAAVCAAVINIVAVWYLQGGRTDVAEAILERMAALFCCYALYAVHYKNAGAGPLWILAVGVLAPGLMRLAVDTARMCKWARAKVRSR